MHRKMAKHSRLSPTQFSTFDCLPNMQAGKRQRRQSAAALVVQSLWSGGKKKQPNGNDGQEASPATNGNNNKKQSERPVIEVPPMGFGPIRDPNQNDVLCGRGGLINGSKGNVQFRNIVATRKLEYNAKTTKRNEKAHLAAVIVRHIRNMDPPGRFLREDVNGLWFDIGDAKAIRKTGQALRECAPSIRQEMEGDEENNNASGTESSDGEGDKTKASEKAGSPAKPTASMDVPTNKKITKGKKEKKNEIKIKTKSKREATSPKKGMVEATPSSLPPETSAYPKSKASMLPQGPPQIHPMAMAMPRMSGGAVFNNSHSRINRDSMPPPEQQELQQQQQQWRGQHPHEYYPAPQHVDAAGHHSMHVYPPTSGSSGHNNMHPSQHQQYHHPQQHPQQHHPPYPYPMHHQPQHHMPYGPNGMMMMNQHGMHSPPVPMQPQSNSSNNDAAFGMAFFAPNDVNMESSERTSSIMSDISGLSSNMTNGKQQQQHNPSLHSLTADHLAKASEQNGHSHHSMMAPPPVAARQQDGSLTYAGSSMLDATSSLPGNDDAEMLSSMCGGAVSSLAMASVVSEAQDPNKKPSTLAMMKQSFLGGGGGQSKHHKEEYRSTPVLQPLPPTLSNPAVTTNNTGMEAKDGSTCVSGKSEASFPFSVGSMSNFSDDFRALTLNLSGQSELEVPDSNNGAD